MTATVHFTALPGPAVDPPALGPHEIHLWSARLDVSSRRLEMLQAVLSDDERRRAERFRQPRHRRRFTAGWGLTRALLGAYSATPPQDLELRYGPKGKPALCRPSGGPEFNLSHSGEQIVVALSRDHPLGVDIEQLRQIREALPIARKHFSAGELARLEALPASEFMTGFFHCWTRKEALIKAVGEGVFVALDRFDVSLGPGEPARLLALDGEATRAASWSLFHLEPTAGVIGALATEDTAVASPAAWAIDLETQTLPGIDREQG